MNEINFELTLLYFALQQKKLKNSNLQKFTSTKIVYEKSQILPLRLA